MSTRRTPQGWGPHGRPATLKPQTGSRREHKPLDQRRWVEAQMVRPGDALLGHKGGIYIALEIRAATDGSDLLDLLVDAPSGSIRTWHRKPTFLIERA